jgi:uncharacterized protein YkwD
VVQAGPGYLDTSDPDAVRAAWAVLRRTDPPRGSTEDVGACQAGTTSAAFRRAELDRTNAYRALAGVAPVSENPTWSSQAQQTALMMAAQRRLSHDPAQPWACWSAGGRDTAGRSNLALGLVGGMAIDGYVADSGAEGVGHRRWMLCPSVDQIGFGDVADANATKVFGETLTPFGASQAREQFVAWPYAGLYPVGIGPAYDRHSVSFPSGTDVRGATVSVTSSSGQAVSTTALAREDLYCSGSVVWSPGRQPAAGEDWTVRITGLRTSTGTAFSSSFTTRYRVMGGNADFVRSAYADFLDRPPTADELARQTASLDAGTSRRTLLGGLATSQQWTATIVTRFYRDTLGRAPDSSGLGYWTDVLRTGRASVAQVAALFYASPEYFGRSGTTLSAWVDDLYGKLLTRTADRAGREYWVGVATAEGRTTVAHAFYQSLESREARTAGLYQALLRRAPDPSGKSHWAGIILTRGDLDLAVELASSVEYFDAAQLRF